MNIATIPSASAGVQVAKQEAGSRPPQEQEKPPEQDEFQATSPDKNRIGYEVAFNLGRAVNGVVYGGAKTGQYLHVAGQALGMQTPGIAGVLGLMGGTYDVAQGASMAMQSSVNRNLTGAVQGSLKVLQGVATYASVLGPSFGAPAVVGQAAAIVAAGALAGQLGISGYARVKGAFSGGDEEKEKEQAASTTSQAPAAPAGNGSLSTAALGSSGGVGTTAAVKVREEDKDNEDGEIDGDSRTFENVFAATSAVRDFASRLGGIGAFWNNVDTLFGGTPGGIWGVLGIVGSTFSVVNGMGTLARGAANQHKGDTIGGALHVVQGLGSVGASLGMGRPAAAIAVGAWVARTAYMIYSQAKEFGGDENEESMTDVILDNFKNSVGFGSSRQAQAA